MKTLFFSLLLCFITPLVAMNQEIKPTPEQIIAEARLHFLIKNTPEDSLPNDLKFELSKLSSELFVESGKECNTLTHEERQIAQGVQILKEIQQNTSEKPVITQEQLKTIQTVPYDLCGKILQKEKQEVSCALPWYRPNNEQYRSIFLHGCMFAIAAPCCVIWGVNQGSRGNASLQDYIVPAAIGLTAGFGVGVTGKYLHTIKNNREKQHYQTHIIYSVVKPSHE